MKKIFTILLCLSLCLQLSSQCVEASMQSNWITDDLNQDPANWVGNIYNDIWGLHVNSREFAVMGSYEGTHFIDVTDPTNPIEVHFVEAAVPAEAIVHRDFHDYAGYVYTVADEGAPNSTLQIIDVSELPAAVNVVYDSNDLFSITHNIFIDTAHARMYTCDWQSKILSLDDPENPVLLYTFNEGYVHDMYVRDNIGYLNMGSDGFMIVDFSSDSGYTVLGTLDSYPDQGYNHSGWLSEDAKYYVMADETHGTRLKVLNVDDPADITVVALIDDGLVTPNSIAHNVIIKDDLVYVSYYYDGVQVFSIADPANPVKVAEYDTYDGANDDFYRGAWGVYPNLESGNILVSDMQTGLYVISVEPQIEFTSTQSGDEVTFNVENDGIGTIYWSWDFGNGTFSTEQNPTISYTESGVYEVCLTTGSVDCSVTLCEEITYAVSGIEELLSDISVIQNSSDISLSSSVSLNDVNVSLVNLNGRIIGTESLEKLYAGDSFTMPVPEYTSGLLILQISTAEGIYTHKFIQP